MTQTTITAKYIVMSQDVQDDYRQRIYAKYVSSRANEIPLSNLNGLAGRLHVLDVQIRRHVPQDKLATILDLGCGHGAILHGLRLAGYKNLHGVDGSKEQIELARCLGIPGVKHGDIMKTLAITPDSTIDCILTYDVIEHLTKIELLGLVDDVRRVLSSGGRWIIHAPNGESPFVGRILYGDLTHELAFTRGSLTHLLLSSGFTKVDCFEDRPVVLGVKSSIRAVLWQLIRLFLISYIAIETGGLDRRGIFSQNLTAVAIRGE